MSLGKFIIAADMNDISHLLYFKLTLARPLERDITMPRDNKDEKGVDFEGGAAGSIDNALRIAISTQLKV